jgi:hypothetical protein
MSGDASAPELDHGQASLNQKMIGINPQAIGEWLPVQAARDPCDTSEA